MSAARLLGYLAIRRSDFSRDNVPTQPPIATEVAPAVATASFDPTGAAADCKSGFSRDELRYNDRPAHKP